MTSVEGPSSQLSGIAYLENLPTIKILFSSGTVRQRKKQQLSTVRLLSAEACWNVRAILKLEVNEPLQGWEGQEKIWSKSK